MKGNKKILIIGGVFLALVIVSSYSKYKYDLLMATNTKEVYGYFYHFQRFGKTCSKSYFKYFVNGKKYETDECGYYEFLQPGDTVLIKYSLEDVSKAEVLDFYYMKKYKHLKN